MTTIAEIQKLETGAKVSDLTVVVKKTKKKSQLGDETTQEFVLSDTTGEILAEILLAETDFGTETLIRNETLNIRKGEIQQSVEGTRLYVSIYERLKFTEPPEISAYGYELPDWEKVNRGKVRHGLCCGLIRRGEQLDYLLVEATQDKIEKVINYIMEGK